MSLPTLFARENRLLPEFIFINNVLYHEFSHFRAKFRRYPPIETMGREGEEKWDREQTALFLKELASGKTAAFAQVKLQRQTGRLAHTQQLTLFR